MSFNSLQYFLFLPIVFLIYYFVHQGARWSILLVASIIFYAALGTPYLLIILLIVTGSTYIFGIWLDSARTLTIKRSLVWGGISFNVLILLFMKYIPFIFDNLRSLGAIFSMHVDLPHTKVLVAIGVSFYIFQAISYLFDIYLENIKPERHFGYFALYLAFFPKLLQGPIERAEDLIPQLKETYTFNYSNVRFGLVLFLWGLFKKVIIADRLGMFVNSVYNDVHSFHGIPIIIATYFYSFQIYMDFSGYTDMAIGSARIFNINLSQNFNSPYLAISIADFWRRWHITFSKWILDYIFKPLQMQWRDGKNWGISAALMITFLVSGLWHGATWGFVIWGGLHGIFLASSVFYKPIQKKLHKLIKLGNHNFLKPIQIIITFNLVTFAWIFFRASSLDDAFYLISNFLNFSKPTFIDLSVKEYVTKNIFLKQSSREFVVALVCLGLIMLFSIFKHKDPKMSLSLFLDSSPRLIRWGFYYALFLSILFFAVTGSGSFIYYQF